MDLAFYLVIAALVIIILSGIGLWVAQDKPNLIVWRGSLIGLNVSVCLNVYVVYDSLMIIWG
jgi:thiosulfate reductase cytochrome b subunit